MKVLVSICTLHFIQVLLKVLFICVFLVVMGVPISPAHRHIPVLEMEQPWLQELGFQTRIWSLYSFTQQVQQIKF